jgi:hypothetical protein
MGLLASAVAALSLFFAHGLFSNFFGLATALVMALAARYLGEGLTHKNFLRQPKRSRSAE